MQNNTSSSIANTALLCWHWPDFDIRLNENESTPYSQRTDATPRILITIISPIWPLFAA